MDTPQLARLVVLDERIRKNCRPTLKGFSQEYEVTERTIRRDLDFLKYSLHAPLEQAENGGYYYAREWDFPPLLIKVNNHAQHLWQLIMRLKELSSADCQYVLDQAKKPSPPQSPRDRGGLMTFSTGPIDLASLRHDPTDDLIAQIRRLTDDELKLVLNAL